MLVLKFNQILADLSHLLTEMLKRGMFISDFDKERIEDLNDCSLLLPLAGIELVVLVLVEEVVEVEPVELVEGNLSDFILSRKTWISSISALITWPPSKDISPKNVFFSDEKIYDKV